ncbi:uncharacterized protein LOC142975319 [Anticarsia gemmatalis]|uniref:uncharacterized protein LOC142975319 n=1 Tax=Anticarsia gemmatalis TaxID=129554 RepID=UPI003F771E5A
MFVVVALLCLLCVASGDEDVRYRCSDHSNTTGTLTPSADGVGGRYTAELCTLKDPDVKEWHVQLWYYLAKSKCLGSPKKVKPLTHSHAVVDIDNRAMDCKYLCYQVDFDLVFGACYTMQSEFTNATGGKSRPWDKNFLINNTKTLADYKDNKPQVVYHAPGNDEISLIWNLGVSVKYFTLTLNTKKDNITELVSDAGVDITRNCSLRGEQRVSCALRLAPGCYRAYFQIQAPWAAIFSELSEITYGFCYMPQEVRVSGASARVWWACGAVLLGAAALVATALARRALRTRNYHKHVLESWRRARECEAPRTVEPRGHNILLLYAREGDHGQQAIAKLKALLQDFTGGQVLDLYSAEVLARAAGAPGAWVRGALCADTRVLLLQSPAAAALYTTHVSDKNLNLQEPLLGRRAMYRSPQFGDQLFLLALRLVAETPAAHHDYNKYYLATYSSLETDILQQVVPFRRYVLPATTPALLRDIAGAPDSELEPALLQDFQESVEQFVLHVKENPDYLMDELVIM